MSTISEKLIQLKNIKQDIKQSVNNLGGNVGDDLSTYAEAINRFATYENPDFYDLRTAGGTNYNGLFCYCNIPSLDLSSFNTSNVSNMSYMFDSCDSAIKGIENWDTSNVSNTSYMFHFFTNKNTYLDLSVLDFSNASNVGYMFQNSDTDYLDVRNINLTGTTSYERLFDNCKGTELDLSSWNISNVTSLSSAFYFSKYKKIDLTGWNTVNVTNMGYMFYYASSLTTLLIPDWDMTNTTNIGSMFGSTSKLQYIDASRCNDTTMTKLASLILARKQADYGEIIVRPDLSQDVIDALIAKYWKPIGPKFDLISTEPVFELDEIKPGKTTKVYNGNNNPWYGDDRLETIEFISSDESVATVDGREIRGVAEGTVEISVRNKETQAILDSKTLSVSETDNYPNLIKFRTDGSEGTSTILTVNGTNIKASQYTKDAAGIYSYDPGKQITSIKFNIYTTEIVKFNFNATNITSLNPKLFSDYIRIKHLDLSEWDVSNITDMKQAFSFEENTISINITGWDTSNVTDMTGMFYVCRALVDIIGEFDLSSLSTGFYPGNDVDNPVYGCKNLETLYLKNIYKNCTMYDSSRWCINLGKTKVKDSCLRYIINELPNLYDKGITNNTRIILTLPPTNTLTESDVAIAVSKGWVVSNITYEVNE